MKARSKLFVLGGLVAGLALVWTFRVSLTLACIPYLVRKGESDGQWLRDQLIDCGPSSIGPVIAELREHSPWARNYCYLPSVLKHFGEPARQQLHAAIDAEPDAKRRASLVSALQSGFGDFSYLGNVLEDPSLPPGVIRWLETDVLRAFPDAPPMTKESALNPEFMVWWRARGSY